MTFHPALRGPGRLLLVTRDAHGLHARAGFRVPAGPASCMEVARTGLHVRR